MNAQRGQGDPSIALIYRQARWTLFILGEKGTRAEAVLVMLQSALNLCG